jgi:osomolarity two-component system sensor histidine kinase NIK1
VHLIYDVDPDIPDQLIGDFLHLQQVITILVSNAIKFTSPGVVGHVSLSCRRLALDHSTVTLEVCVADEGIGIAKDKLKLISDAFAEADCSTIRVLAASYICSSTNEPDFSLKVYKGAGLGLSISKCLVSLMGGSMWVESVAGEGSKFFFTITSQIGQLSMDATLAKTMPFENRNILFVDTQYDRTGAVDRIQELRLKPYVIHDSLELADKATCPHIDIIIVDSLSVVCYNNIFSTFSFMDLARQTETIREYEH